MFRLSDQRMAARVLEHDWNSSSLGAPDTWPQALRTIVGLMLSSRFPMFVAWGPDLTFIYNDAYAPMLGEKEPRALGNPFAEVWEDIWGDILPLVNSALHGRATWMENLPIAMRRNGYLENTHFTFSYSPAFADDGSIAGMFCACQETTKQVEADRVRVEREATLAEAVIVRENLIEQKDMLLAEVNHRVKNSLQLVGSALSLQARRLTDPVTKAAFEQAITRVRAISSVHERLYKADNPMFVSMPSYLRDLAEDLGAAPELSNRIEVQVDDIRLKTELAIPVALIVNELVTNAMKYAYPPERPGPISLSLIRREDEMLELSVADKGAGMEAMPTSEGLGSRLVAAMATQVQGKLERYTSQEGFRVEVVFPAGSE